jgi:hypothetical protein
MAAAAAIVTAGGTTGVSALLVPAELHVAGASPGQIGLVFAVAGVLFVVASSLTTAAGRRAVRLPVVMAGMLALALSLSPAIVTSAPIALVAMQCATTAARSLLWTVSYPLAAAGSERSGPASASCWGCSTGCKGGDGAAGPAGGGLAADRLSAQAVFGLTAADVPGHAPPSPFWWQVLSGARPAPVTRCPGEQVVVVGPDGPAGPGPTPPSW